MKKILWTGTVLLGALAPAQAAEPAPRERVLAEAPPGPERTPRPAAAAWDAAEPVRLARHGGGGACKARLLREWLRIDCNALPTVLVRTLGSSAGEESFLLDQPETEDDPAFARGASVIFPVRRGDRRVIEILSPEVGYRGHVGTAIGLVISEQWLDGDAGPIVSVL